MNEILTNQWKKLELDEHLRRRIRRLNKETYEESRICVILFLSLIYFVSIQLFIDLVSLIELTFLTPRFQFVSRKSLTRIAASRYSNESQIATIIDQIKPSIVENRINAEACRFFVKSSFSNLVTWFTITSSARVFLWVSREMSRLIWSIFLSWSFSDSRSQQIKNAAESHR